MRLQTFGRVCIVRDDGEEVKLQPLSLTLLAYLTVGGPQDRDHLASLFWHNSKNGLNSLSTTLNRIRAKLPDAVSAQGNTQVGIDLPSDVSDLRDAIDRSDFTSVMELYSAAFLGGLRLRGQSPEFEEWLLAERATLAATAELALLQEGRRLHEVADYRSAAVAVEEAWKIAIRDGFPSPDYFEEYHRILASAASPVAGAVRSMAEEFGIDLRPVEPVALEAVEATNSNPRSETPAAASHVIAATSTPLFGCQRELDSIVASVASNRLTTLVGLGGSGKTRLATEFFNSPTADQGFPHKYWVSLRDVTDPELVAPTIAASLGQRFEGVTPLANWLAADEPVLLVLDNFEDVLEAAEVTDDLTTGNETVHVLVTSRVPLQLASESLVQLTGLDVTDDEAASPAVQLFVSSARRAGVSEDRLDGSNLATIHEVCRRVGGNPLALEIAGGWTQILSPSEILDALSSDNELLGAPMVGDLRSMEKVLIQSWSTLDEIEQNTLMLLATFPGGCLTREALTLQGLPIKSVGRLVQHSLARLQVEGRITLHPLVAGHALSELERRPEIHKAFRQVLSDWCQAFCATVSTNPANTHSQAFEDEITNFTAAWRTDALHHTWQVHAATQAPLREFFAESGRVSEGRALFGEVVAAIRADPAGPQDLLVDMLEALAWFEMLSGKVSAARGHLDEALALCSEARPHSRAKILRTLGTLHLATGDIDEATAQFNAGLELLSDEQSPLAAMLQHYLAQAHQYRGAGDQARAAARLALRTSRASDDWGVMVRSYLLLADIEVATDPQRAIVLLKEGWVIANEASLDHLAMYFPLVLGAAYLSLNEPDEAEQHFTDAQHAASDVGEMSTVCASYVGRAEARLQNGKRADAIGDLETGIRLALKTGSGRYLMWAAVVSCRAAASDEFREQTRQLLARTLAHPASDQDSRDKALVLWNELFDDAPATDSEPSGDGDPGDLDEVAERSLELLISA